MRVALVCLATCGMFGLVTVAAALLVPACGLWLPFVSTAVMACPVATELKDPADDTLRDSLRQEIAVMELQLAGLQCARPAPVLPTEPAAAPRVEPVQEPEPQTSLDGNMIDRADLDGLRGCWQLGSAYAAQNKVTGVVIDFPEWTVCFDGNGNGTETMRGSDGSICEGSLTARFVPGEALVIEESEDLPCSGGFAVLRRTVTCRLDQSQRAVCDSYQPEGGGTAEVIMRRQIGSP